MFDAAMRRVIDPPLARLARLVDGLPVSANAVTVAGFALGLGAMGLIMAGMPLAGLVLLLLNRFADGLDGAIARRGNVTDLGGFLDITLDFIIYSGLVFAFAVADPAANALPAAFLIFSFMGTGCSFLAYAIMAAKRNITSDRRGPKSLYYLGGLAEGTETIAVFVLFCLAPGWFAPIAWTYGAICWITTASRVFTAWSTLRD